MIDLENVNLREAEQAILAGAAFGLFALWLVTVFLFPCNP